MSVYGIWLLVPWGSYLSCCGTGAFPSPGDWLAEVTQVGDEHSSGANTKAYPQQCASSGSGSHLVRRGLQSLSWHLLEVTWALLACPIYGWWHYDPSRTERWLPPLFHFIPEIRTTSQTHRRCPPVFYSRQWPTITDHNIQGIWWNSYAQIHILADHLVGIVAKHCKICPEVVVVPHIHLVGYLVNILVTEVVTKIVHLFY